MIIPVLIQECYDYSRLASALCAPYITAVNFVLRNTIACLALVVYVAAGVLLEVGHRHPHDFLLAASPTLSSHSCGEKEIHLPLDKRHDCLACVQSTQRVSGEAMQYVGIHPAMVCSLGIPVLAEQGLETNVLYSGKRGPPFLFL